MYSRSCCCLRYYEKKWLFVLLSCYCLASSFWSTTTYVSLVVDGEPAVSAHEPAISSWKSSSSSLEAQQQQQPLQAHSDGDASTTEKWDAIVVGSGSAGLAATLHILDRGGNVLLMEKEPLIGGNSNKASSGINSCCSETPASSSSSSASRRVEEEEVEVNLHMKVQDSADLFRNDTLRSAGRLARPDLIDTLVSRSQSAVDWLQQRVGVNLSQLAQLGGHSAPRTHRPPEGFVGAEMIASLLEKVQEYQSTGRIQIMLGTKVVKLITDEINNPAEGRVVGVEYQNDNDNGGDNEIKSLYASNVILATGGFASDRSAGSYMERYRPELLHMSTTAGAFSTGDGITLARTLGAGLVDMDQVQLHPTGWVDPAQPNHPTKTLAAELLRGVGGMLLDPSTGQRFCNELGTRAYVSGQMLSQHHPEYARTGKWNLQDDIPTYALILSSAAAAMAEKHVGVYRNKGLIQKLDGITALAEWMKVPETTLMATFQHYHQASLEGRDEFDKTVFNGMPAVGKDLHHEVFYVGTVTPVLHYCMGGIRIDTEGSVLDRDGRVIPGLHAAGEVTGGVHGANRLGGNSLLECTVFGSLVGEKIPIAARQNTNNNDSNTAGADIAAAARKARAMQAEQEEKDALAALPEISSEELKKHNNLHDCWVAVHGIVYDLTDFMKFHPGGLDAIVRIAGKDGTPLFTAIHNKGVLNSFRHLRVAKLQPRQLPASVERLAAAADAAAESSAQQQQQQRRQQQQTISIPQSEVEQHSTPEDCWVAIYGYVYDLSGFSEIHPGGREAVDPLCGTRGTGAFAIVHNWDKLAGFEDYKLGRYDATQPTETPLSGDDCDKEKPDGQGTEQDERKMLLKWKKPEPGQSALDAMLSRSRPKLPHSPPETTNNHDHHPNNSQQQQEKAEEESFQPLRRLRSKRELSQAAVTAPSPTYPFELDLTPVLVCESILAVLVLGMAIVVVWRAFGRRRGESSIAPRRLSWRHLKWVCQFHVCPTSSSAKRRRRRRQQEQEQSGLTQPTGSWHKQNE